MGRRLFVTTVMLVGIMAIAAVSFAAKTYQVTGNVVELGDKVVLVEKSDGEKWELDRDAATKVTGGDLKVGQKVTIHYVMIAKSVEVKGEGAKSGAAKEAKPAAEAQPKKK